jgi:hypothetical protein
MIAGKAGAVLPHWPISDGEMTASADALSIIHGVERKKRTISGDAAGPAGST